ncbi:sensor histidine kinase [Dyadobacter jejuensis]|uniref:sensor histidine kinase n=1 Tax=Dyadobacter jejuensis TaxID=1082580 RepID=UPI001304A5D3|nr:sensor histidine kinase [Dyadobacter jejuensis]
MFILVVLNGIQNCLAQIPQTRVNIQLLGPEQGLPSRNVRCLAQDRRGFMWVATGQDLWRYDGYNFQNFTETLTRSIGSRTLINQLRTAPDGNIWVAHNNGFSILDPVYLTCRTVDPSRNIKGVDSKQTLNIFFDKNKNAWMAIPYGKLIRINMDYRSVAVYTPPATSSHSFSAESLVVFFFNDLRNNAYLFSEDVFLDEIDSKANFIRRISLLNKELVNKHFHVSSVVQQDIDGLHIYYRQGDSKEYLMRKYFFGTGTFGPLTDIDTPIAPKIISPDKKGNLWLKSAEEIGFVNQKTNHFTDLTTRLQQKSGARIFLFASLVSTDGSFWISCVDGLFKITLTDEVFRKYLSVPLEKPGDIGSSIRGITQDPTGKIWVCSYGFMVDGKPNLLHQIDPATGRTRHMILKRPKNVPGDTVIPYKVLFAGNQVYAVTDGTQFIKIDPEREQYYSVELPFVSGRGFTSFYKLNEYTFWMGTWGGMAVLDTRDLKPVLLNEKAGKYIKNERVNHFMPWSGNRILVSTTNGLYVLNPDATIHEHYGQTAGDKIKLPALQIFHTLWYEHALWAGSGKGLIRIDTLNQEIRLFTTEDGLPDNNIYAALPDEQENLWLSTNKGLSRFNTHSKKFHNYAIFDGLPHMEFNHGSYLKSQDGTLYFGGLNGIVAFDPARLDTSAEKEGELQLISYSKYASGRNHTDTVTSHKQGNKIILEPDDRLFTFSFMSTNYHNTALNRFRYKLEGWNDDRWHMFEDGNKLLFNSLPPGEYNLKVQVSAAGADWGTYQWQTPLIVLAPWYKSVWFFILSIISLGAIFYAFYQYRLRQILKIQQIRNGISADMHDEIGGTLSSISFYSQALLMQIVETEHQQVVQKIKENAQQVQEGLSDIVWSVKAGKDQISDVFARMLHFGGELAESKGYDFHFNTDTPLNNLKLDMQTRKNFYLIFKEAINNAAKYAECSAIYTDIGYSMGKVKMVIRDNGKGFDKQLDRQGNGLINMRHRAMQMKGQLTIQSTRDKGTVITLLFLVGR